MVPAEGYSLTHAKSAIEDADWVSGDHRIEGTIVAVGPNVKPFESQPALIDMAPTIVAALDAPTAVDAARAASCTRSSAPSKALDRARGRRSRSRVQIPGMGETAVSDTEADEMEEHLRGLGYIE